MIEIKHRLTGGVLLKIETLAGANLSGANLSGAYLSEADLSEADLSGANLSRANLSGANLSEADLSGANLSWANLSRVNLSEACLSGADLSWADLSWADLSGANLSGANLFRAYLSGADLSGAYLFGADLSDTCLDPNRKIQGLTSELLKEVGFEVEGGYVFGYRSAISTVCTDPVTKSVNQYIQGETYSAPWFSRDIGTECHPGLYLCPTIEQAKKWHPEIVKVRALVGEVILAGEKFRCPSFYVIEQVAK